MAHQEIDHAFFHLGILHGINQEKGFDLDHAATMQSAEQLRAAIAAARHHGQWTAQALDAQLDQRFSGNVDPDRRQDVHDAMMTLGEDPSFSGKGLNAPLSSSSTSENLLSLLTALKAATT